MTPEAICADYPEMLSSEQVRIILGISKRKAAWLLQNGHIKCRIADKQTRRYTVERESLIEYMTDREVHPEKYIVPSGIFSTAKDSRSNIENFPTILPSDFKGWLEDKWCDLPDLLTADMVEQCTGYTKKTVQRWMRTKRLKCAVMPHGAVTSKAWLVKFYCGGFEVRYMCDAHRELVRRYLAECDE